MRAIGASLVLATVLCGCPAQPEHGESLQPAKEHAVLAPLAPGHGRAQQLGAAAVQLSGHRIDLAPDDWVLCDGGYHAVVSRRKGRVIALGRRGGSNGLVAREPGVFEGLSA